MRCAIFGCNSDNQSKVTDPTVRFFSFPKEEDMKQAWVDCCGRADKFNIAVARVCSLHFAKQDYARNLKYELLKCEVPKRFRPLKREAVPSLRLPEKRKTFKVDSSPVLKRKWCTEGEHEAEVDDPCKPLSSLRVCRTCLTVLTVPDSVSLRGPTNTYNDLYRKLIDFLQIEFIDVEDACLCKKCAQFVTAVSDFKLTCTANEYALKEVQWGTCRKNLLSVVNPNDIIRVFKGTTNGNPSTNRKEFTIHDDEPAEPMRAATKKFRKYRNGEGAPFFCTLCSEVTLSETSFNKHMKRHCKKRGIKCGQCGLRLPYENKYLKHIQVVHRQSDSFYPCYQCPKRYLYKRLLVRHLKLHEVEKAANYCTTCKKAFDCELSFDRHRSRHNSRKVRCRRCGAICAYKNVRQHVITKHTGLDFMETRIGRRFFDCDVCGKEYLRLGCLNLHKKQAHADKIAICSKND